MGMSNLLTILVKIRKIRTKTKKKANEGCRGCALLPPTPPEELDSKSWHCVHSMWACLWINRELDLLNF